MRRTEYKSARVAAKFTVASGLLALVWLVTGSWVLTALVGGWLYALEN